MKKLLKKCFPTLMHILHGYREKYYVRLCKSNPEYFVRIWYKKIYGKSINLESPQDIDEKVNWMKLHADMSLWSRCADKFEVRSFVAEKGLAHTLNEIYGVFDTPEDIDFDVLPKRFVIKTTNGGGGKSVLIVKDKDELDINETRNKLRKWQQEEMGWRYYEPHYFPIRSRLLIEKYLEPNAGEESLVDIKLNCFDGNAYSVFLCSDRSGQSVHYSVYDMDWRLCPEKVLPAYSTIKKFPRPKSFNKMVAYSQILSKGIPYVRVDWYEINGEPIFSEMTFTPGGGFQHFYSQAYLSELGRQMNISQLINEKNQANV